LTSLLSDASNFWNAVSIVQRRQIDEFFVGGRLGIHDESFTGQSGQNASGKRSKTR